MSEDLKPKAQSTYSKKKKKKLNEKDNIIKPKGKHKQLKTRQHLAVRLQTKFCPQRTMQS